MWNVDPSVLCRKHLLGEHVELHMAVGSIRRGKNLGRFISDGLIETATIQSRHQALALEMARRGYHHQSPLHYIDALHMGRVDPTASMLELARRCPECRARITK
jgi:hypothetical protein